MGRGFRAELHALRQRIDDHEVVDRPGARILVVGDEHQRIAGHDALGRDELELALAAFHIALRIDTRGGDRIVLNRRAGLNHVHQLHVAGQRDRPLLERHRAEGSRRKGRNQRNQNPEKHSYSPQSILTENVTVWVEPPAALPIVAEIPDAEAVPASSPVAPGTGSVPPNGLETAAGLVSVTLPIWAINVPSALSSAVLVPTTASDPPPPWPANLVPAGPCPRRKCCCCCCRTRSW